MVVFGNIFFEKNAGGFRGVCRQIELFPGSFLCLSDAKYIIRKRLSLIMQVKTPVGTVGTVGTASKNKGLGCSDLRGQVGTAGTGNKNNGLAMTDAEKWAVNGRK